MIDSLEAVLKGFGEVGGELTVGGKRLTEIVKEHPTPAYFYERSKIRARHDLIRKHLPPELLITYAVKANPNVEVLREMGRIYDGVDIASMGEMERAMEAGIPPSAMSFAGPGKTKAELAFAVGHEIGTLSIESERELEHIAAICAETGKTANIMVRVNPAFELSRAGLKMGGGSKQFGIDSELVPGLIGRMAKMPGIRYAGIHIFSGTQNLSYESILETVGKILDYASELTRETGVPMQKLNLGGGFGIPYFKGDGELELSTLGAGMKSLLERYRPSMPGTRFKIELGRFLVGECGIYVASIIYKKQSRGGTFLIMDGGMHHHLPASGNMNQSPIRRQMHVIIGNKLRGATEKVNVVGPLCTPLDNFALNAELPKAEEGDLVVVLNSGAYGYSISPLGFLSHKPPREVMI